MIRTAAFAMATLITALPAAAFEFEGGSLSIANTAIDTADDDSSFTSNGSLEFGFGGPFSIQVGVGQSSGYSDFDFMSLHGIYDINPTTSVGLFVVHEDWEGDDWETVGIEARTTFNGGAMPVELQGFIAHSEFGSEEDDYIGLAAYLHATESFSVYAQAASSSGQDDIRSFGIGAIYTHDSGAFGRVGVDKASGDSDDSSFTVELGFKFGGGTTFREPSWATLFPGY